LRKSLEDIVDDAVDDELVDDVVVALDVEEAAETVMARSGCFRLRYPRGGAPVVRLSLR
jgi:hypothetical protein